MSHRRILAAAVAAAATLALVAPTTAVAAPSHRSDASQTWGEDYKQGPGHLLRAQPLSGAPALPSAGENYKVWYTSTGEHGEPIIVTGTVALPATAAPRDGWPVVSWAHGTTGVADICAPSNDTLTGPAHGYLSVIDETLDKWVGRGYVVAQTDYQGLGTPGPHPYVIGRSEAHAVTDIVRAARELNRHVGAKWVTIGHSQGGQAALFTDRFAQSYAPGLDFRGAVSIAPGSYFSTFAEGIIDNWPGYAGAIGFLPLVITGAAAVNPAVQPAKLLTPAMLHVYELAQTTDCLAQLAVDAAAIPVTDVFQPGADIGPLTKTLQRNEPDTLHLSGRAPVLVVQGTTDVMVAKASTDRVVAALCQNGATLDYRVYEGADHRGSVSASLTDVESWVDQRMAGVLPAPSTC